HLRVVLENALPSHDVSRDFAQSPRRFCGRVAKRLCDHRDCGLELTVSEQLQNLDIEIHIIRETAFATWLLRLCLGRGRLACPVRCVLQVTATFVLCILRKRT